MLFISHNSFMRSFHRLGKLPLRKTVFQNDIPFIPPRMIPMQTRGMKRPGQYHRTNLSFSQPPLKDKLTKKNIAQTDVVERSKLANFFINCMMRDGKKKVATKKFRNTLKILKHVIGKNDKISPMALVEKAVLNVTPLFTLTMMNLVGRPTIFTPHLVHPRHQMRKAVRWLISDAEKHGLARSILMAFLRTGPSFKRCQMINYIAWKHRKNIMSKTNSAIRESTNQPSGTIFRSRKGVTRWRNRFITRIYGSHVKTKLKHGRQRFKNDKVKNRHV